MFSLNVILKLHTGTNKRALTAAVMLFDIELYSTSTLIRQPEVL